MPGISFDIFAKDKGAAAAFGKITKNVDATRDAMQRVTKANDAAAAASARLRKAQGLEADAVGKVKVAAAKLEEVRKNSKASSSRIAAAEEALASAQRRAAQASDATADAVKRAASAQEAAKSAASDLAKAQQSAFEKIAGSASKAAPAMEKAGEESAGRFGIGFSKRLPELGTRITGFFKTGIGTAAGLAAGALAGSGFVASFNTALEQNAGNAKLKVQLGLSAGDAAKAGKVAGDLYRANYGDSVAGVNDAIKSVIQNTNVSLNSLDLKPVTAKVLDLTSAFDQDLGGVTRAVGQLMRTGLVKNAGEALDVITRGLQSGADKGDDFLDTLNEYPTQFRKLGLDAKTATGILSQGLKAGARDSDIVADALKEFSIRAVDGSKTTADGFKKLGLSGKTMSEQIAKGGKPAADGLDLVFDRLRKIKDPVKQSQIAVELFGTQAEDLGKALYAIDPSTAVQALGKVAGAAGEMDKTLGTTPQAIITSFFRTIKQRAVDSLGGVLKAFETGQTSATGFQGVLERVAIGARDAFKGLGSKIVAGIGTLDLSKVGNDLWSGASKWAAQLIDGWKNGVEKGNWKPLGKALGEGLTSAIENIGEGTGKLLDAIGSLFDKVKWDKLGTKISDGFLNLVHSVDWGKIGGALGDAVITGLQKAKDVSAKLGNAIKSFVDAVDWEKVGHDSTSAIGRFIAGIDWVQLAKSLGAAILGGLKIDYEVKNAVTGAAANLVTGMLHSIIDGMSQGREWIVAKTKQLGGWLIDGLREGVVAKMADLVSWTKTHITDPVIHAVKSLFGIKSPSTVFAAIGVQLVAGLKGGIIAGARGIGSWLNRSVASPVVAAFTKAGSWLMQAGKNLVAGFRNGVSAIASSIGSWLYRHVISPAVAQFGKAGSWLHQAGKNVIAGFKNGMTEVWSDVTTWVGGIATWIKDHKGPVSLDGTLLIPAGRAIMSGFLKGLKSGAGPAWDFVSKVGGKTVSMLQETFGPSKSTLEGFGGGVARWAPLALKALRLTGHPDAWLGSLLRRMNQESGGNPRAINLWDSNAKKGTPSMGLMQTILPTFNAYAGAYRKYGPWDPLANIIAAINYTVSRYGSGPAGWDRPGGYRQGTPWVPDDQFAYLHKGEAVIPAEVNKRRLGSSAVDRVLSKLHQLHEAHVAHLAHLNHVNRLNRGTGIGADTGGNGITGGVVQLHDKTIEKLARKLAEQGATRPLLLDGHRVDVAMSNSAMIRGYR